MRKCVRVVLFVLLGLLSTAVLGAVTALMAAVSLAATALIVPGTGTPNANIVQNYRENFRDYYMQGTPCTNNVDCPPNNTGDPANEGLLGINYPATFWPIPIPGWCPNLSCDKFDVSVGKGVQKLETALTSLHNLGYQGGIVIAGYSQGARVATIEKYNLANGAFPDLVDQVSFVFIGNPNRPNGGILSRFGMLGTIPIVDVTTGQPTPTGLPDYPRDIPTEDWAIRWEGIADFPQYLLNPLAVANSVLGFYYDHGTYLAINEDSDPGELPAGYDVATWRDIVQHPEDHPDVVEIRKYGDTTYYTVTPKVLPLVRPLHDIPVIGKPIADLIEPALRVIIEETGYNRNIPYGQPSEIQLVPVFDPATLTVKLIPAIVKGIGNFLGDLGLGTAVAPTAPQTNVSPLTGQREDQRVLTTGTDRDELTGARLRLVQGNGDDEQQQADRDDNAGTLVAKIQPDGDLTLSDDNEAKGTTERQGRIERQGTVSGQSLPGNVDNGVEVQQGPEDAKGNTALVNEDPGTAKGNNTMVTEDVNKDVKEDVNKDVNKDPDTDKKRAGNTISANGGGVSLNFSTNKPTESVPGGGVSTGKPDPTASLKPADEPEGEKDQQPTGNPAGNAGTSDPGRSERPAA